MDLTDGFQCHMSTAEDIADFANMPNNLFWECPRVFAR